MLERTWGHGRGRTRLPSRGGRPADCRWLGGLEANVGHGRLLYTPCSVATARHHSGGFGTPNSLVSRSRSQSAAPILAWTEDTEVLVVPFDVLDAALANRRWALPLWRVRRRPGRPGRCPGPRRRGGRRGRAR